MTDYHGEDWPLRVTKYWDDDQKEVVFSAKLREEPIELRKILGYYEWVFNAYEEVDKEVEPGTHGSLTLQLDKTKIKPSKKKKGKSGKVDPAHVKGEWDTCGVSGSIAGLSKRSGSSWTFENLAEEPDSDEERDSWDDEPEDFSDSHFVISVVDVIDDNGHPFVQFTHSPGMHEDSVTYIGKKQRTSQNAPLEGLTDGERQRLGMFVTEDEIKRAALEVTKASDADANDGLDKDDGEEKGAGADTEANPRKRRAEDGLLNEEEPPCKK
ncbi:hypothetical protein DFH06DRAFT_1206458 [Mycena polygramma]|nr:hypothetical protein DFH06DRAFT_1206458 [Mycena polygramma]